MVIWVQFADKGDPSMSSQNESSNPGKRFKQKKEVLIVVLLLGIVLTLLYYSNVVNIPFKSFTESDLLSIITSMFVVAVFMERSVEAILIPVRAPDRQKIEQELEDIRKAAQTDDSKKDAQLIKERELQSYRLITAQRAYWLSFAFGLVISLVGVRTLAGLVEPDALAALGGMHRTLFSFVDIVLTGGVIAGGSAAIDKIAREISRFFNLNSGVDPKPPQQQK